MSKGLQYVFGAYFVVSMLYILSTLHIFGSENSKASFSSQDSFVKRDGNMTNAKGKANVTLTISRSSPSATPTLLPSSYNLRVQSWNIRSAFLLKNYEPIQQTMKDINSTNLVSNTDTDNYYYWNWKENSWSVRRIGLTQQVEFYQPDIFAIQEALSFQVDDLNDLLPGYDWIGVGRDNNKTGGEFEVIFYNKHTLKLVEWDTFWLSSTPLVPSKMKCASAHRDATVAKFVTVQNSKPFTVINTHWDDKCDQSRRLAASLIKYRAAYEFENTKAPVILTGDFNSEAYGSSSGGYEIITGVAPPESIDPQFSQKYANTIHDSFVLADSYFQTPPASRIGNFATYTGFYKVQDSSQYTRIDFHMVGMLDKDTRKMSTTRYFVPGMFADTGFHLSDHRPVITEHFLQ